MKIALFILFFLNLSIDCASKLTISNPKTPQNEYFEPLNTYQRELAKYNRLKRFYSNSDNQEPVKEQTITILEIHVRHKEYLADFFENTKDFHETKPNLENQKDLEQKFWQIEHITKIIAFKENYEKYQNDLKNLQSTLEQIKLPDQSSKDYNEVLQELINKELEPFQKEYEDSYKYNKNMLFNFQFGYNENLQNIDFEKTIRKISFNFLKTISCAKNDLKKIDFLNQIYENGAQKYKPLVQNEKPLQNNIHSLLQSIIYNNPLFIGVFDYYNDCVNKKFPATIENAVQQNLLNDVLQYYRNQLNFDVETTPEQELQKIEHNAMTIISLNLKPIVQKKFIQKYPSNQSCDDISEIITTSIFQPTFEFKDYSTIENLINNIIDNLEFPVNQESIVNLITIFHNNQNDQDTRVKKKESIKPEALQKVEVKGQKFNREELDNIEYNSDSEESLQKKKPSVKNDRFLLGGVQQSSILIPKKNIEIFNNSSKTKLERSTSENNISKKRTTTKSSPQLSSKASNTKNQNTNSIKVEPHKNTENLESINQGRKSSSHSSFKTPRIVLFSILTLASFWFVVTIFKKLYRFVR